MSDVNWDAVLSKQLPPGFIPNVSIRGGSVALPTDKLTFLTLSCQSVTLSHTMQPAAASILLWILSANKSIVLYVFYTSKYKHCQSPEAPGPYSHSVFSLKATKMRGAGAVARTARSSSNLFSWRCRHHPLLGWAGSPTECVHWAGPSSRRVCVCACMCVPFRCRYKSTCHSAGGLWTVSWGGWLHIEPKLKLHGLFYLTVMLSLHSSGTDLHTL